MKVDKALLKLIHTIRGQAGVLPYGNELTGSLYTMLYRRENDPAGNTGNGE
jgi:hypothetical protein